MGAGRRSATLLTLWWDKHGDRPVAVSELDPAVRKVADPQGRGRQYLTACLANHAGTRIAGFVLTRQEAIGRWGKATYALEKTAEEKDHRGDRGHRGTSHAHDQANGADDHIAEECNAPMVPMTPMPSAAID